MPTDLIVEVSSNHGGERAWMDKFIDSAAIAGATYCKFQSFQVKHLDPDDKQYAWFKQAELSDADHRHLVRACERVGVQFLTTAFTADRVEFLHDLGLKAIKVGSGEAGETSVLAEVAKYDWRIYLSTGLVTAHDLERAVSILAGKDVILMHTVSEYPTPLMHANLTRMSWLAAFTGLQVGYSDHTIGKDAALCAIAMGAPAVEVHHSLPGAPRASVWDKDLVQLKRIGEFARGVETMKTHRPMLKKPGEARPYVGRWQN